MTTIRSRIISSVAMIGVGLIALTGCGLQPATAYVPDAQPGSIKRLDLPEGASLTITSKNFTEQLILGKIAVIAAKAAGFTVNDMTNVPGSVPARELMLSGTADMTWEYTGTAWLAYLGQSKGIPDKQKQYQAVKKADAANGLTWLQPAPLNNTYALAVRDEATKKLGNISSLSQIADLPVAQRTFCVESEFNSRADGMNPMLKAYGLTRGKSDSVPNSHVKIFDTGAVYTATDRGTCNFGEVFTTDGRIDKLGLTVLKDDKAFFPAYNVAAVVNSKTLAKYPALAGIFAKVSLKITETTLRKLNLRVDDGGEEPADVAYDFMQKNGFITAAK
ncbi:glycine betaine ABC transporter substrate-binding protein [Glaciihabitans sp. UYNi722]|uniref:glycine betaine ABC transporter substrate-binding protein n=1 Tax=Glaciihabitans sp. UYNi722 TaxID=3156344 RepID=UPI00339B040E